MSVNTSLAGEAFGPLGCLWGTLGSDLTSPGVALVRVVMRILQD